MCVMIASYCWGKMPKVHNLSDSFISGSVVRQYHAKEQVVLQSRSFQRQGAATQRGTRIPLYEFTDHNLPFPYLHWPTS